MQNTKGTVHENFVKDDKRKEWEEILHFRIRNEAKREVVFKFVHTFSFLSVFCFIKPERINLLFLLSSSSLSYLQVFFIFFFLPPMYIVKARFKLELAEYHFFYNFSLNLLEREQRYKNGRTKKINLQFKCSISSK